MKVLYLTNLPVPYRMKFFNELGKLCDLTVLVERMTASNRDNAWLDSIGNTSFKMIGLRSFKIGEESSLSFEVIRHLRKNYDLIVIGGYSTVTAMLAITFLKLRKRSFILNADGGFVKPNESALARAVKKFFISGAAAWITTSADAKAYFSYYGAAEDRIFIYPFTSIAQENLHQASIEEKQQCRNKLSIPQSSKMLLTVGQIIPRKGLDILLRAFSKLSEGFSLYVVGGQPTPPLVSLMEELQLQNVNFVDFQAEEHLKDYYSSADAFVFPTRFDVWGLVVNEAMSHGLPVISSDAAGAAREMIRSGNNGLLFPSEDVDALSACIEQLFQDPLFASRISEEAFATAKAYTIEKMAKAHHCIFTNVLASLPDSKKK